MRTIRRQVYVRERRLALLQLRQGKCRCAVTVRTSAGYPRRGCASPTLRTFRPVVARISRKSYFGLFEFPAFALHHFLFCVATKIAWPLNRISLGRGQIWGRLGDALGADVATTLQQLGGDPRDGSDMPPPNLQIAAHFCADYSTAFRCRSMSTRLSRSRQTPGIFCVDIWPQGDAANIANFPCNSGLMSPK